MEIQTITQCRVCEGTSLVPVFSLGDQYVATTFINALEEKKNHQAYPLELVICGVHETDGCGFVQLKHTLSRDVLFETYWYRSGINQTMRTALSDVVTQVSLYTNLKEGDVVCDVGCNDGTLLSFYPKALHRVGIDPAKNMAQFSKEHASQIVSDYFTSKAFFGASTKKAKVVTSIAMFYSVIDPVTFARHVYDILDDDGVWVLQMSSLPLMIENNCYDNIVHEHVGYYTVSVIERFLKKLGLHVVDGEMNDINAGSVRLYIKKKPQPSLKSLDLIHHMEERANYRALPVYQKFAQTVRHETDQLRRLLEECNPANTCFYGASTKGNVILQYLGVGPQAAFGIAERNPLKYGYYTLGSDLLIISEEEMRKRKPANVIVLPYHFKKEVIQREDDLLRLGSRLIFPLPQFEIYTGK